MEHVGRRVRVYWEDEGGWFTGNIEHYDCDDGYYVVYDDGDVEWLPNLDAVEFIGEISNKEDPPTDHRDHTEHVDSDAHEQDNTGNINTNDNTGEYTDGNDGEGIDAHFTMSVPIDHDYEEEKGSRSPSEVDEVENDNASNLSSAELPANGILLKGEVKGANNLPYEASSEGEGIFYRVLYAEGGTQSAMFRCKTPIYKSNTCFEMEYPRWNEGLFRFEMVMPGDMDSTNFSQHGDIIVALYKTRRNGGSDFVGQISVELQDFITVGTVGKARPGAECRLLRGAHILVDRHGMSVGDGADVDIDIRLEWRPRKPVRAPEKSLRATGISQSVVSGRQSATTRPKSAGALGRGSRIGDSGLAVMNSAGKYKRNRKQKLVNKQNEDLAARLAKLGPKKSTAGGVYKPVPTEKKSKTTVRSRSATGNREAKSTTSGSSNGLNRKSYKELLVMYDELKVKISEAEKDVFTHRTHTNKLKAQMEKQEGVVQRLKRQELRSRQDGEMKGEDGPVELPHDRFAPRNVLLNAGIDKQEHEIEDQVLRELLAEHQSLQEARISLVKRIKDASVKADEMEKEAIDIKTEVDEQYKMMKEQANKRVDEDWNLHIIRKPTVLESLDLEIAELMDRMKISNVVGKIHDDIANLSAQESVLDKLIEIKQEELDTVCYNADICQERLSVILEEDTPLKLRRAITRLRNSIYRLRRQEKLANIKSETDAVELQVLRHNLNHQKAVSQVS
mmetsp:Transcript_18671/g.27018  ORF Transcript_18671/g.27018 Transcript_18671/m.27018 type:complete len:732 (+) Transcript_18671:41-2236(+)